MPSSPRGVCRLSGQEERTRLSRRLPSRCGHRPLRKNVRLQRRGRCLSGQRKRARPYRRLPGRCGHRPLRKTTCVFSVGGDALIAPWGTTPERSRKTNTSVPSTPGPMWASAPTKSTCIFSVGGDALIAPWGTTPERSEKTDTPIPSASGPMWASALRLGISTI